MDMVEFEIKESVSTEGITEDYVWYSAQLLQQKMSSWSFDLQKLVSVMESRHKEHIQMINDLLAERSALKKILSQSKNKE